MSYWIKADEENNAEDFWRELDAALPNLSDRLRRDVANTGVLVSDEELDRVLSLPDAEYAVLV